MSLDWQPSLDALDLQMLSIALRIRSGAAVSASAPSSSIGFPFFHHPIIHSLMKEVARASMPVAGIPLPWQTSGGA